jgi:hypothetical protein
VLYREDRYLLIAPVNGADGEKKSPDFQGVDHLSSIKRGTMLYNAGTSAKTIPKYYPNITPGFKFRATG